MAIEIDYCWLQEQSYPKNAEKLRKLIITGLSALAAGQCSPTEVPHRHTLGCLYASQDRDKELNPLDISVLSLLEVECNVRCKKGAVKKLS